MKKDIVVNYILEEIENGKWKKGNKIFSEYQLQEILNVSCGTVRSAIKELNHKNILETIHGSGTYVKNDFQQKKNYILILTSENIFYTQNNVYKKLIDLLKGYIVEKSYTPLCYCKNNFTIEESFSDLISLIAGVIAVFPEKKEKDYFKNKQIPLINAIKSFPDSEPTIVLNYEKFFYKIVDLIEKYKFKDIVVLSNKIEIRKKHFKENLIFLYMQEYFKQYKLYKVNYLAEKEICKIINNIEYSPDCIVFLDDYLYNYAKTSIEENDFLKNTKIITHSSYESKGCEKNTCKLIFDMNKIARENVELISKIIDRKKLLDYNIFISPIIENEEELV